MTTLMTDEQIFLSVWLTLGPPERQYILRLAEHLATHCVHCTVPEKDALYSPTCLVCLRGDRGDDCQVTAVS